MRESSRLMALDGLRMPQAQMGADPTTPLGLSEAPPHCYSQISFPGSDPGIGGGGLTLRSGSGGQGSVTSNAVLCRLRMGHNLGTWRCGKNREGRRRRELSDGAAAALVCEPPGPPPGGPGSSGSSGGADSEPCKKRRR
jgi:hypothetical protein